MQKLKTLLVNRILLYIFCTSFLVAQIQAQDINSFEKIEALGLSNLKGKVPVYYSEGYIDRANYFQNLVEVAADFFQQSEVLGTEIDLHLVILGPEDWARFTQLPYGIAHVLPEPPTAILAASEDNIITRGMISQEDQLSEATLQRLGDLDLSYSEAVATFVDLIGFHEMGHLYAHYHGSHTWPEQKWLSEFVATYLAFAYMKDSQPRFAELWSIICDQNAGNPEVEYTSLADFENLYLGVGNDNYSWYQARFQQKAIEIYEQVGIAFVHALKKSLMEHPVPPDDDPFRLKELDAICDGFMNWAKGQDGDLK